jgi:hypothetical protein
MFNTEIDEEHAASFREKLKHCRIKWKRPGAPRPEFMSADDAALDLDEEFDLEELLDNGDDRHVKPMVDERFWQIIDLFDWESVGNDSGVIEASIEALSALSDDDIVGFQETLHNKLFELDAERFARQIGKESYRGPAQSFSKSWFLNVRCCAVANGRELFEEILRDAENMPKDLGFRAICRVAPEAYFRKTGQKLSYTPLKSIETFSNTAGWPGLLDRL